MHIRAMHLALAAALSATLATAARAETAGPAPSTFEPIRWGDADRAYQVRAVGEVGFLAVLAHDVQFGRDGTSFDYVSEGGQDTLVFVARLAAELNLFRQHRIVLLYQPLGIQTAEVLERDVVVNGQTFPEGEPVRFLYDFPFYRISYMYDFFPAPNLEVSIGLSLQIRNATITFASGDGRLFRASRDVGLVPLLKARARYTFANGLWIGAEVDGIYAPVSYLNGDDNDITGALIDASLRVGLTLPRGVQPYLNLRYLAGGAEGEGDPEGYSDGYVRNWLHFLTVTLGVDWDIY